ncbi:MAG: CehA/McbA family metallohydrolase, partial [Planctomycetota bacterium]
MSTLIPAIVFLALPALNDSSIVETERRALADSNGLGRVTVRCVGFDDSKPDETWPLAVRVIAKVGDRSLDGSGRGLYSDGRFFAERSFELESPAGTLALEVRSGPDYVSANGTVVVEAGKHVEVTAKLRRWFSPKSRSWYSGDNHVHAQHDRKAAVRTDLAYTALQGRANGLDFVTEAGSHVDYDELEKLSSPRFLFRNADEIRLGCFVGHVNAPGIREPIPYSLLAKLGKSPLPIGHLLPEIHRRGGAAIHTHPMVPPQQIHWMGATELYSDAVLSNCADALDIDSRATEALWFAAINAGNRMAASGSTDAALGRERTRAPGDRRVYVRSKSFDMPSLVRGIRSSHTYATNAGPIHAFLRVEGSGPGETATVTGKSLDVQVEVRHLRPLRSIELYLRGRRVHAFRAASTRPESSVFSISLPLPQDMTGQPWIVLRAEDVRGSWATTSPVYLKTPVESEPSPSSTWASVLHISNATRFIELRKTFFAHVICTVRDDAIAGVALYRDDELVQRITPAEGDSISGGKTPVTELRGDYGPGRIWHPKTKPAHVQWDIPVSERGWYWTRILTASGRKLDSDRMFFDPKHTRSHQVSSAVLYARDTELRQWGYGEEMPLAEIQSPFEGDHWWYPQRSTWRMEGRFGSETRVYFGGDKRGLRLVRRPPTESALAPRKPIRLFDRGLDRFYSWTKDHGYRDPERVFRF